MIWIIGAGQMAKEYVKVLSSLKAEFLLIGRAKSSCMGIAEEFSCSYFSGGLQAYLLTKPEKPEKAIVAVGIESLSQVTALLMSHGISEILLEKPGVAYPSEIDDLIRIAIENNSKVLLAYNRRFYSSVFKAEEIIREDGGVTSFNFEFTEWSHVISKLKKREEELRNWFLGNSTHVIDTAFYLCGKPEKFSAYYKGSLDWHPTSANFCGAGVSGKGALFSYHANWEAPGRWAIEILTKKNRLIFKPMETLQIQALGTVVAKPVEIDDTLDKEFKPGLFLQTKSFVNSDYQRFCTLEEQGEMIGNFYLKMSGYHK